MFKKILEIYKKYQEIINYLIFGVLTTLVSILSYALFTRFLNLNYIYSNIISWIISVTFAFITNKIYVFKSKEDNVFKEVIKFYISRLTSLLIELLIMYLMVDLLKINDMISKIIVQFIVIILNYIFSKIFVFKNKIK